MSTSTLTSKVIQCAIVVIAVAVLTQNLLLLKDNRALRQAVNRPDQDMAIPVGRPVRDISGSTMEGKLRTISIPEQPGEKLLIITFSPGCPFCLASLASWRQLSKELTKRQEWHVVWVSRDTLSVTKQYCTEQELPVDQTIADPTYRTYAQLALKAVPNTVVVGAGGHVEKVWNGSLDTQKKWSEVAAYFNLQQKEVPSASPAKEMTAFNEQETKR
jgi:peroxiredoxin